MVASLIQSKRAGYSFEAGWKIARQENPPRSRVEREIEQAVRGYMEDAWYGRKPRLRHFSLEMLRESDRTGRARSAGTWTVQTMAESVAA